MALVRPMVTMLRLVILVGAFHLAALATWIIARTLANPGRAFLVVLALVFSLWLTRQFMAVEYTHRMLDWAGIPAAAVYIFVVVACLLLAAGALELRSPFEDIERRRHHARQGRDDEPG